jgi:SSS family solute:Na+ symporter
MMQAWWMFVICSVIFVVVSLFTPRPTEERIRDLTWEKPTKIFAQGAIKKWDDPRLVALGLFILLATLYFIFR